MFSPTWTFPPWNASPCPPPESHSNSRSGEQDPQRIALMAPPVSRPMLEVRRVQDSTVIRVVDCDSLNEYNSDAFGEQLSALLAKQQQHHVILDLEGIRYATSSALGKMVWLNHA